MRILLTGATGLVGRYLVRDLLLAGSKLVVLIRSQRGAAARERLGAILSHWEGQLGRQLPRPVCLEGDITQEGLGLSPDAREWVAKQCTSVLHNAASLTFEGKDRDREPWLSNLTGTRNVLELCRQTGLRELHHVSTAYVCGKRAGPVFEDDLDCGQEHRNDYERCKFEAERLVRSADFLDRVTVYRPAIIVGDSQTGYTSTYHGPYAYFQFIEFSCQRLLAETNGRYHAAVRLNLTGEERRNLVPVDWVSAVIAHLVRRPEHHGKTYHLTPRRAITAREIDEATSAYFNYAGPEFAGPDALAGGDLNELEKMFYTSVEHYQPYWAQEPTFDCTNTCAAVPHLPCPVIDRECLYRLLDFAVSDRWGKLDCRL